MEGALARVEHPHRQTAVHRPLKARARRRPEHGGADEAGVAQSGELMLDEVDAALLNERHAEQRLVRAVEDVADGVERLIEGLDRDVARRGHGRNHGRRKPVHIPTGQST